MHALGAIATGGEAGAGAGSPGGAVQAVLPSGADFQAGDVDHAAVGDEVASGAAVAGQGQSGGGGCGGVDGLEGDSS